jgi:hypothetical protein
MDKKIIKKILNLPYNTKLDMDSKIFAILRKTPKKTELSAISDLEDAYNDINSIYSDSDLNELDELENNIDSFLDLKDDIQRLANNLSSTLDKWGKIDYQLRDGLDYLDNSIEIYNNLANDLGIDTNSNSTYVEALNKIDEVKDVLLKFDTIYSQAPYNEIENLAN